MSATHYVHRIITPGLSGDGIDAAEAAALRADVAGMPTVISGAYTKRLGNYASLAAAIADLPDGGANGGEILIDGEIPWSTTATVPAGVHLHGRGSGNTALVAPAGINVPLLDLDGASGAQVAGIAFRKEAGAAAGANADAILIRGASSDILIDDIDADELRNAVRAEGSMGTTPGVIERLTIRSSTGRRSPNSYGFVFGDVDVLTLLDCHGLENWLDGFKLRKSTRNVTVIGGSGIGNGQGYLTDPGLYAGDGIDAYAGGDTFSISDFVANENYGHGVQIKSGDLNETDPVGYGYVRRFEVNHVHATGNLVGAGLQLNLSNPASTTEPLMTNYNVNGGMFAGNAGPGVRSRGRNVVLSSVHAIRNTGPGIVISPKSMDTKVVTPMLIANGYPTEAGAHGIEIYGHNVDVLYPTVIGRDSDTINSDADYTGTTYTNRAISIHNGASGVINIVRPSMRYCMDGNRVRVDSGVTAAVFIDEIRTANPTDVVMGSPGSVVTKTNASFPWEQNWIKRGTEGPNSTNNWAPLGAVYTVDTLPSATARWKGLQLLLAKNGAGDDELYICVQSGPSSYAWRKVTLT